MCGGGGTFAGLIDEFHISKVQRTDAEILAHATRVIGVSIDMKPGSDPNCFNVNGHGVIPVAIFGAPGFDVADIDTSSLLLGGLAVRVRGNKGPQCGREDSSGDGIDDLVCQFEDDPTSWVAGGAMATLTGLLTDGTLFEGNRRSPDLQPGGDLRASSGGPGHAGGPGAARDYCAIPRSRRDGCGRHHDGDRDLQRGDGGGHH